MIMEKADQTLEDLAKNYVKKKIEINNEELK